MLWPVFNRLLLIRSDRQKIEKEIKFHKRTSVKYSINGPGGRIGGINEHCPQTSNFDAKKSRSEPKRTFHCHILAPIKQLLNQLFNV